MSEKNLENVQRWTAKRRSALVLSILKGETSTKEAARGLIRSFAPTLLRLNLYPGSATTLQHS